jgi:hypothetical protein
MINIRIVIALFAFLNNRPYASARHMPKMIYDIISDGFINTIGKEGG